MAWAVEFSESAAKQLAKLDRAVAKRIVAFLRERLAVLADPRTLGAALQGDVLGRYWRYRVGDWRIICDIDDLRIVVTAIKLGRRSDVYRR